MAVDNRSRPTKEVSTVLTGMVRVERTALEVHDLGLRSRDL